MITSKYRVYCTCDNGREIEVLTEVNGRHHLDAIYFSTVCISSTIKLSLTPYNSDADKYILRELSILRNIFKTKGVIRGTINCVKLII